MEINDVKLKGFLGKWGKVSKVGGQQLDCYNNSISVPRYNTQTKKNDYTSFNITAWNKIATELGNLPDKTLILITSGKLILNEYKNKDGIDVKDVKVLVNDFEVLGSKYNYQPRESQLVDSAKKLVSGNGIQQFDDPTDYSANLNINEADLPFSYVY